MILYFSGTGNSRFVANRLAGMIGAEAIEILKADFSKPFSGKSLGFVFPVYSWGIAPMLLDIIKNKIPQEWFESADRVWCALTCGDETGLAHRMLMKAIRKRGVEVESVWSVEMPNTYVLLPGFDVDPKNTEKLKLRISRLYTDVIYDGLEDSEKGVFVNVGKFAWFKTKLIYPLFKRWGISTKKWHSTAACIGCGKCAGACPLGNVDMKDGAPRWGKNCCSCLACYHVCPRHAVAYGKITAKKGQYYLPADWKLPEINPI